MQFNTPMHFGLVSLERVLVHRLVNRLQRCTLNPMCKRLASIGYGRSTCSSLEARDNESKDLSQTSVTRSSAVAMIADRTAEATVIEI